MDGKKRKESLDFALGMLFIAGSLSFNLVESPVFKKFVSILDPTYDVPTRQTLSTTIIEKVKTKIQTTLKPRTSVTGTLMIDGWKNTSNNSKTVTVIVKPQNMDEIFLKSYDFSKLPESHSNLLPVVEDAVQLSHDLYGIEVTSYVSDNAANMLKTGKESNLISYGCKAHTGNLYVQDVFSKPLFNKVHEILVQFKNTTLQTIMKDCGGKSIYLANETRWKVKNRNVA